MTASFWKKTNQLAIVFANPFSGGQSPFFGLYFTTTKNCSYSANLKSWTRCLSPHEFPAVVYKESGYTQRTNYVIKIKLLPPTKVSVKPCIVQETIEHWNSAAYCQPHENWTNSKRKTAEQRERTYVYISSINCSKWRCCVVAINCLTPRQQTENTVFPTIKYEHHTWCACPPQMDAVFVMAMLLKNANSSRPPWGHQSLASNIKICTHLRCHSSRAWQLAAKVTRSTGFDFYCSYKGNAQNRRLFCVIKMFFSHWKLCLVSVVSILKDVERRIGFSSATAQDLVTNW